MKQDEIENKKKAFLGEKIIYDNLGQYIWAVQKNGHHQKLADLRGWGAIQNLFTDIKDAEKFQDELGELIAKTLHDHLLSKKPSVSDEEIKNKAEETYKHSIIEERAFQNGAKWALSLTPPDAEKWISVETKPELNEEYICAIDLEDGHDHLVVFACEYNIKKDKWYWSGTEEEVQGVVLFWSEKLEPPKIEWEKTNPIYPVLSLDQQERLAFGQCVHGNNLANCSACNDEDSVFYTRKPPINKQGGK